MSKVILSPSVLNPKLSITLDPIKHASHLPIFDGCWDQLKSFTDMVDVMVPILQDYDTSSQIIVSNIIKSRIVGKAKEILDSSPHITKWEEIKKILYANFSDQRNSSQLLNELRSTEFRGSIIDYINLIQKRLTNLNLKVEQEQKFNFVRIIQDNHTIALEVLKNTMPEPVRTILFCRNPTSIENVIFILPEMGNLYQKKVIFLKTGAPIEIFQNLPNQSYQSETISIIMYTLKIIIHFTKINMVVNITIIKVGKTKTLIHLSQIIINIVLIKIQSKVEFVDLDHHNLWKLMDRDK
ncbi:unnamed protein product [Hermetia illucens]|uniref:Retrotransposon gag domain-containing protein n=1 Tax=Hermetia illucens TaxID=343691 RepID=A0A7R8YQS1_HERIL|nr:unnamed protein product [Hermetia illucens]